MTVRIRGVDHHQKEAKNQAGKAPLQIRFSSREITEREFHRGTAMNSKGCEDTTTRQMPVPKTSSQDLSQKLEDCGSANVTPRRSLHG